MIYKDPGYNRLLAGNLYSWLDYHWLQDNQDNLIAKESLQDTKI